LAIEVRKRNRETTTSLLRRFSRRVQQSGILLEARRNRFHEQAANKRAKKQSALRREKIKTIRDDLIKQGKLMETEPLPKGTRLD
jgi:ribosomal protein S21